MGPGLKLGVASPKSSTDGGTKHMIEGVIPGIFIIYTNLSISEKLPLWKLFSYYSYALS